MKPDPTLPLNRFHRLLLIEAEAGSETPLCFEAHSWSVAAHPSVTRRSTAQNATNAQNFLHTLRRSARRKKAKLDEPPIEDKRAGTHEAKSRHQREVKP